MDKSRDMEKLHKGYISLLNAIKNHNIDVAEASIHVIKDLESVFWSNVTEYIDQTVPHLEELKSQYTNNTDYTLKLDSILKARGIMTDINENNIIIGPIDIVVNVDKYNITMTIGRKKTVIKDLEISIVAKLIEATYKKINSSFNSGAFFRRLLRAYEYAYTRMYACREVSFGYGVSLKDLFDIFTISPNSADYKLENFLWDLGRLISSSEYSEDYRVELGFSRDVKKMYVVKTVNGENLKVSTLTIHKEV